MKAAEKSNNSSDWAADNMETWRLKYKGGVIAVDNQNKKIWGWGKSVDDACTDVEVALDNHPNLEGENFHILFIDLSKVNQLDQNLNKADGKEINDKLYQNITKITEISETLNTFKTDAENRFEELNEINKDIKKMIRDSSGRNHMTIFLCIIIALLFAGILGK